LHRKITEIMFKKRCETMRYLKFSPEDLDVRFVYG